MFGKDSVIENEKMETIIGPDTHFQGTIRSKGYIRVDGKVEGGLSAEAIIVGENGQVQGDLAAKTVVVGGRVTGNIISSETLELQAQSQVIGDIRTPHLTIADGALFEGNCIMSADKNKIIGLDQVARASGE